MFSQFKYPQIDEMTLSLDKRLLTFSRRTNDYDGGVGKVGFTKGDIQEALLAFIGVAISRRKRSRAWRSLTTAICHLIRGFRL
jgi:hypothetical protein